MTRVLVTNDDGIASEGLRHLALAAVAAGLDVVVAAPCDEASGSSAALTSVQDDGRILLESRTLVGLEGIETFAVPAAPAFIALLATHGAFGEPPAFVLSGINRGLNAGHAVLHSGTVGATTTGATQGRPGMAVSIDVGCHQHWETAEIVAGWVLPSLLELDDALVLNVNVPNVPIDEVVGLRQARLAAFGAVQTTVTEAGAGFVQLTVEERQDRLDADTDAGLVAAGLATVTPLRPLCEDHVAVNASFAR